MDPTQCSNVAGFKDFLEDAASENFMDVLVNTMERLLSEVPGYNEQRTMIPPGMLQQFARTCLVMSIDEFMREVTPE